jgi:hypothetical protein
VLPKVESKDASSLTNSSVSDLEKTMPKKPFRINSKASVGVSTEEKKSTKPTVKDLSSSIMPSQSSQTNIQPKPVKFRLADLDEGELENSQLSLMANKVLMNRVKEDKVQYQQFLERLGLMKYYDQFWELGIDSLEGLSKVTVEDFNHLYIPAGTQIKIQKELKKAGVNQVSQTQDMGLDTSDLPSNDLNITPLRKTVETKTTPKINFGIKMKATNKPTVVTTCSMAIETDPVDSSDIPLNVNEDLPPASISSISTKPKTKKVTFSSSGTQSDISASDQPLHEFPNYSTHNTVESAPFSFTNIGGAEWTNCFDTLNDEQRGQGRSGYIFQRGPGAVLMTPAPPNLGPSTRVSCYSCFRQLEPEEAFDHRHMPGKVRQL